MVYCDDVDLLYWEPAVFSEASGVGQVLISGTGTLAGTTFSISSGSFVTAAVAAGCVVSADAPVSAALAVVSVDSGTALTTSVVYGGLYPDDGGAAVPVAGTAGTGAFAVRTFSGMARVVSEMLDEAAGVRAGTADRPGVTVVNPDALRRACALGVLALVYRALAPSAPLRTQIAAGSGGTAPADVRTWVDKAAVYERLYTRALRSAVVEVDTDGDGVADERRGLGVVRWVRE